VATHPSDIGGLEDGLEHELRRVAPRPQCLEDTGLTESFLADLLAKHLLDGGVLTIADMVERLALSGKLLEQILHFMRQEARVEVLSANDSGSSLRYGLTDRGRTTALDATLRGGYIGPAPVPLQTYSRTVRAQTVHDRSVTKAAMHRAFDGVILKDSLLDQLGPSLNSGRAIFIYGPAGTGKTYIAQKLRRLFHNRVLIPHAISINETVLSVFDPLVHRTAALDTDRESLMLDEGYDPRFVCCERPVVISGGELTADMLEIQYDPSTREYRAPLQLKANNGMFMIDDMGRQKVEPEAVFNRWIVPMEEKKDYLSLGSGRHFSVPFDVVLIFSTNMHPLDLADEAFLRRIGYKIEFNYLTREEYRRIWEDVCKEYSVVFDQEILQYVLNDLHHAERVELLPCHPRDLLGIAVDLATYMGEPRRLTKHQMRWAWRNYFVSLKPGESVANESTE